MWDFHIMVIRFLASVNYVVLILRGRASEKASTLSQVAFAGVEGGGTFSIYSLVGIIPLK